MSFYSSVCRCPNLGSVPLLVYPASAALSESGNHSHFQEDEDQSGDEDNFEPDAAFLEFILRRIQQVKNDVVFEQLSSPLGPPRGWLMTMTKTTVLIPSYGHVSPVIMSINSLIRHVSTLTGLMKTVLGRTPFQTTFYCKSRN